MDLHWAADIVWRRRTKQEVEECGEEYEVPKFLQGHKDGQAHFQARGKDLGLPKKTAEEVYIGDYQESACT